MPIVTPTLPLVSGPSSHSLPSCYGRPYLEKGNSGSGLSDRTASTKIPYQPPLPVVDREELVVGVGSFVCK